MTRKLVAGFLPGVVLAAALVPAVAQQRPFSGAVEIEQSLHKLNQLGTLLMIAAHPDDERTQVLAYFARGRYMRTAYLSLTRGEGGQNLIGSEQGAQLGLIRTQELLAARQIDGAEQFFTRAIDFGFTRTTSETLQKWGHDRILSDVVWVIRRYRPDVIVCGFSGTPSDGHGQHQTSAILAHEAFTAAADPARFPEQLQYVQPWRARRIVQAAGFGGLLGGGRGGRGQPGQQPGQAGAPGSREPAPPEPVRPPAGEADTGAFNPILGYSYEELAVLSRSMHHSQGTGAMRRPGGGTSSFSLVNGDPASKDLFDGIDTTWNRLPGGGAVGSILGEAIRSYEPAHPEKVIPLLVKARPLIAAMSAAHSDPLASVKLAELDETIALCAGLWIEAQARQFETTPGSKLGVTATVMNRSTAQVTLDAARLEGMWNGAAANPPAKLALNQSTNLDFTVEVPAAQPYSQPYWLAKPPAGDVYTVDDQMLIGLADTPPLLRLRALLTVEGTPIEVVRPVHHRYGDRAEGERTRPLIVVPAVAVNLTDTAELFPAAAWRTIHVSVMANVAKAAGNLRLDVPAGWNVEPKSQAFEIAAIGEQREMVFAITPPAGETTAVMHAVATVGGREIGAGLQVISYTHIPVQTLFPPSDVKLVRSNVKVTVKKVGYIMGAGDEMPDALRQLGLDVTVLSPSDLAQGDLSRFEAIVCGVRGYNVRADLRANQPRLMEYVKNGGTYIVQYQTGDSPDPNAANTPQQPLPPEILRMMQTFQGPANTAPVTTNLGPYPFSVPGGNRYRVTVEEAPVTFPNQDSPLLQYPNHINPKDFDGWVQERGLYFATKWDPHYQTVIASHDPDEQVLEGGELWTRYGKGIYIFTSYAWFRQLPAGVPGAYRLFANLLSAK
ncbi:MAG TPA: PIG-L family deacetylase [Candidatus Acidoferrales bacterium]|nr:PIG-L family deacetylase [Candidatus Acidoferrales bacterium]